MCVLARLSIFNVFYFLFVLLPLLLGVLFINNEVRIFSPSSLAVLLRYLHPIIVEFELNLIIQLNFWSQLLYRRFPIPYLSFIVISTCFHFLQMHLSEKMIFHLEMVILRKNMRILYTIQKFLCKLVMKTHMHLPIGNHFLLFHVIIRPNKIKDLLKDWKSAIFKMPNFCRLSS